MCILFVSMSQEVDIGLAADVGTLQRLPKIVGNDRFAVFSAHCSRLSVHRSTACFSPSSSSYCSLVRELAYTARKMPAEESMKFGLVR